MVISRNTAIWRCHGKPKYGLHRTRASGVYMEGKMDEITRRLEDGTTVSVDTDGFTHPVDEIELKARERAYQQIELINELIKGGYPASRIWHEEIRLMGMVEILQAINPARDYHYFVSSFHNISRYYLNYHYDE